MTVNNPNHIAINNSQSFNNNYGLYLSDNTLPPANITINNSIIYNNNI